MSKHTTEYPTQEVPYGYCHCGCGQKTKISTRNDTTNGYVKGEPRHYVSGHNARRHPFPGTVCCACGCGTIVKTYEGRFAQGHNNRSRVGRPVDERFWENVIKAALDDCWLWTGTKGHHGYGMMSVGSKRDKSRRNVFAHRLSYELHYGPIPSGAVIRHTCDNPSCVNPGHLIVGSHQENMRDMVSRNRQTLGTKNPQARITADDVRQIRALAASGTIHAEIAPRFGITRSAVTMIVERKRWAHVD